MNNLPDVLAAGNPMEDSPPWGVSAHGGRGESEGVAAGDVSARRPPFSREAEQSLLGAILLSGDVLERVADVVVAEDFFLPAHRTIYGAMLEMSQRGEPPDPVLLQAFLERRQELEQIGGFVYLTQLVNTVPTAANAESYARLVRDKAVLRNLGREGTAVVELVHQSVGRRVDEILDEAEARIFAVGESQSQRRSSYFSLRDVIKPVFAQIELRMEQRQDVTGVSSGFMDLDRMLSGLQPSDLVILAGRPAMGKTALAMNMAANAAVRSKVPVAVFSLEMSKEQLTTRLLASEARVNAMSLRSGQLRGEDYGRISHAAQLLSDVPLYIDDSPALSVMAMRAKIRRMKKERGIGLVVVDYLQLMRGSVANSENRVQEISEISRGLKAIAKEMQVPVLALSQLSRSVESRTDKRPILSDLRESGSIEQDADVVLFVFRPEYYKPEDTSLHGRAEVIVAKQRNGPVGMVQLTFLHALTRFENFATQEM
ncbi:MAG: replicative DNA helicase [Magnetococcus sp. WYHC-3]